MKTYYFLSIVLLCSAKLLGQDIHFSQMTQTGPYVNPAMTGFGPNNTSVSTAIRTQWAPVLGKEAFKTALISIEHREKVFQQDQAGLGLTLFSDQAGALNLRQTQANLSFSYAKTLVKSTYYHSHLLLGLYAGVGQRSVNYEQARWGSQFNPSTQQFNPGQSVDEMNNLVNSHVYTDAGAGLLWYIKGVKRNAGGGNFGVAISHFAGTHREFRRSERNFLAVKYTLHAGAELPMDGQMYFLPTMVLFSQNGVNQLNAGAALSMTIQKTQYYENALTLGLWMRMANNPGLKQIKPESFAPVARIQFTEWEFGLSYDFPLTELRSAAIGNGALELNLKYSFNKQLDKRTKCPRMF